MIMKPVDADHGLLLQRHVDEDTRMLKAGYCRVGDVPMLLERWTADGVTGLSAVLLTRDAGRMNDEELKRFLTEQADLDLSGSVTICRRDVHTFVNFGFAVK